MLEAFSSRLRRPKYGGLPKRLLDIAVAASGLVIAAPIMALCALAIWTEGGGPVIFKQSRVGADRRSFICYKFRTMSTDAPHNCATAELDHPERYITRVGGFLRRTSLDELPQLFNVLRGDMSLIGPRPVLESERELVGLRDNLGVYSIRPGMTGLAQIRGRDVISIRRKAAYDAQYVERMSFGYDLALFWQTLINVALCRNVREGRPNV